jgi:hypothetical protein
MRFPPIFQCLKGRDMAEILPRNIVIVNAEIPHQCFFKSSGRFKFCLPNNLSDSAVETLDHAVCPRPARLNGFLERRAWLPGLQTLLVFSRTADFPAHLSTPYVSLSL